MHKFFKKNIKSRIEQFGFSVPFITCQQSFVLDFLRVVALMLVVNAHLLQIFIYPYWNPTESLEEWQFLLYILRYSGQFGVMIFFSLSGFLIYYSIINNINKNKVFDCKEYFLLRFFRIYPPLIFSIFILMVIHYLLYSIDISSSDDFTKGDEIYVAREDLTLSWKNILGSSLLINDMFSGFYSPVLNGPLWSIAYEFWFYMAALVFTWVIFKSYFFAYAFLVIIFYSSWEYVEWWCYGWSVWFVAFAMTHIETNYSKHVSTTIGFAGSVLFLFIWLYFYNNRVDTWYEYRSYYPLGIIFSFLLPVMLNRCGKICKFLNLYKIVSKISGCSYTIYLLHFPVFMIFFVLTNLIVDDWLERLLVMVFALLFCFSISYIIACYLEDKKLIKHLVSKVR